MNQDRFNDDELLYADEEAEESTLAEQKVWKVLIVDDEELLHSATRIALDNFRFADRPLEFLSAYSGQEARELLASHKDIAMVLLDVVMETDEAGLEVAQYIRETLDNQLVQIVLRTGQPGSAPEKQVISQYDINDYREKTELTELRMYTTVTTALRAYRNLNNIEKNRKGLKLIIDSTGHLFADQRLRDFTEGVLTQIQSILRLDEGTLFLKGSGFAASREDGQLQVLAATGDYHNFLGKPLDEIPINVQQGIETALSRKESIFTEDAYVGYYPSDGGTENLIYLHGCHDLEPLEKDLIRTFSSNIAIAYDRVYLTKEIQDTQREVIETLGSVVESRSNETANHVRRVAEITHFLALHAGFNEREAILLKQASIMHDVGKIGIPDAILNKPGKLTADEYELIKTHASVGHRLLKNSKREIMKTAAIVAQQHHERWDGQGYPQGLVGSECHIYGRITALADVFDAMFNKRVYKNSMPLSKIVEIFRQERGKQFDPEMTDLFLNHIDEIVELNNRWTDD